MKSRVISLSAISAGFISLCLIIGVYFEITDLFMLVTASIFVLLPLYYKSYKGSFLAYLAGGIIAMLCSGFNFTWIFPAYFLFFGIYPIVRIKLAEKNTRNVIVIIIGLIWIVFVSYVCYFYYTLVLNGIFDGLPYWLENYIIYGVFFVASFFFFIYNRFVVAIKIILDKYLNKIIK